MTESHPRSPALPALPDASSLELAQTEAPLDAHGFDPRDYDWHPVARQKRADGWTHTRQRTFIEVLADTGSVKRAALAADMSIQSCYRLRRAPGAENFARAWSAAIEEASQRLVDVAFERAIEGVAEPVLDKDGQCIAVRRRVNDRLLMFLLRAHQPERYRHANQDVRQPGEAAPATSLPVSRAIDRLTPETPAEPHALLDQDELDSRLLCADLADGVGDGVPCYLKDGPGDCDLTPEQINPELKPRLRLIRAVDGDAMLQPTFEEQAARTNLY